MKKINKKTNNVKIKKMRIVRITIILTVLICIIIMTLNNSAIKLDKIIVGKQKQSLSLITTKDPDTSKFRYVKSKDNINVPVPYGYTASSAENEQYVNALLDNEGNLVLDENGFQKAGGFVIYEGDEEVPEDVDDLWEAQKTRNQYVWVPISSEEVLNMYHQSGNKIFANYYTFTNTSYGINTNESREPAMAGSYDNDNSNLTSYLNGITRESFKIEMEERFKNMLESIATYGGFYIGRYETGDLNQNIPKVVRMNGNIGNQNWYQEYLKAKKLKGTHDNIETNMIWGILYDETLKWLIDTKSKKYSDMLPDTSATSCDNAGRWGNYKNVSFQYYDSNRNLNQTKPQNVYRTLPTGATDRNMGNNIYDLAGNVFDRTMEVYNSNRGARGGYCWDDCSDPNANTPSKRGYSYPTHNIYSEGCRVVLYIR